MQYMHVIKDFQDNIFVIKLKKVLKLFNFLELNLNNLI
jgi:hypothetical protein